MEFGSFPHFNDLRNIDRSDQSQGNTSSSESNESLMTTNEQPASDQVSSLINALKRECF